MEIIGSLWKVLELGGVALPAGRAKLTVDLNGISKKRQFAVSIQNIGLLLAIVCDVEVAGVVDAAFAAGRPSRVGGAGGTESDPNSDASKCTCVNFCALQYRLHENRNRRRKRSARLDYRGWAV